MLKGQDIAILIKLLLKNNTKEKISLQYSKASTCSNFILQPKTNWSQGL